MTKKESKTTEFNEIDPTSARENGTSQLNQQSSQANGRTDALGGVVNSVTTEIAGGCAVHCTEAEGLNTAANASRSPAPQTTKAWAVLWRSECRLDGKVEMLVGAPWFPLKTALFASRANAREYMQQKSGYIKNRKDLQQDPHGWKVPKVVQVEVSYKIRVMK